MSLARAALATLALTFARGAAAEPAAPADAASIAQAADTVVVATGAQLVLRFYGG